MSLKFLPTAVVLLLAICAFQDVSGGLLKQSVDMITEVKQDFERVATLVNGQLLNITASMLEHAISVQADAAILLGKATSNLIARIQEVREKAAQVVCSTEADVKRVQLIKNLTKAIEHCVTDKVDETKALIDSVKALVQEANTTMEEAQKKIADCDNGGLSAIILVCQTNEKAKAAVDAAKLAAAAYDKTVEVTKLVMSLKDAVTSCPKSRVAEAQAQSDLLLKQMEQCVANLTD